MKKNIFAFIMVAALLISATAQGQVKSGVPLSPMNGEYNSSPNNMFQNSNNLEYGVQSDFSQKTITIKSSKAHKPSSKGTVFLSETFDTEIPATWTINNRGEGSFPGWFWSEFDYQMENPPFGQQCLLPFSGFAIISSMLNWNLNEFYFSEGELTSPIFDATDVNNTLILEFEHVYSEHWGIDETVEVQVWDGNSWQTIADYEGAYIGYFNEAEYVALDITDYISSEMQIRFMYDDGIESMGARACFWAIDNITVYEMDTHDLAVWDTKPTLLKPEISSYPEVLIHNYGYSTETNFTVEVTINDGILDVYYSTKTLSSQSLGSTENLLVTMDKCWTTPVEGNYSIIATVTVENDAVLENNSKTTECSINEDNHKWYGEIAGGSVAIWRAVLEFNRGNGIDSIFSVRTLGYEYPSYAAEWIDGEMYRLEQSSDTYAGKIFRVNHQTGMFTELGAGANLAMGMSYDPIDDILYIMDNKGRFYTFDITMGSTTPLNNTPFIPLDEDFFGSFGVHCIGNGVFYIGTREYLFGESQYEDKLFQYDINTEELTLIGIIPDFGFIADFTYDWDNEKLYFFGQKTEGTNIYESGIYSLDTETLETEMVISSYLNVGYSLAIPYTSGAKLVSTTPYNTEENVTYNTTVSAEFDVDLTEIDLSSVIIEDEDGVWSGNYTASVSGTSPNTIEFTHDNFTGYTEYVVIIPKGSVSDGTRELDRDIIWRFTTGEGIVDVNETIQTNVKIYPNPSTGIFTIEATENYKINIVDISGRVVYISETNTSNSQIDLSNIAKGIYFIELSNENEKINRKIVIE